MTADPCLMPVAGDRLCYLPGDHDGGCTPLPPYTRKPVALPDGTPVVFWSSPAPVADEQRSECQPCPHGSCRFVVGHDPLCPERQAGAA